LEGIRGGTLAGVGATEDHALVDACFLLLQHAGRMWIGVGAHHPVEAAESPTLNSPEPISENRLAASWWAYEDVADHWDELTLRTYRGEQRSGWEAIQVSTLNDGDRPEQLLKSCHPSGSLPEGTMLFCAIAAAPARLSSGLFVRCELQDEALGRQIRLDYRRR